MKQFSIVLILWVTGINGLAAQDPAQPLSFDDLFGQFRRGMTFDTTITLSPGSRQFFHIGPDSSSYFYFRSDTSFSGGAMPDFFGMDLFDSISPFGEKDGNDPFDQMFRQMEEMQRRLWGTPPGRVPSAPETEQGEEDGLLPEERIRQREQHPAPPPAKPQKEKIKTIRI